MTRQPVKLLRWPRRAPDGTPLGIPLDGRLVDGRPVRRASGGQPVVEAIRRLVGHRLAHSTTAELLAEAGVDPDDVIADVFARILRKNRQPCAFDPRRASFSKYINIVLRGSLSKALEHARRHARQYDLPPERVQDPHERFEAAEAYEAALLDALEEPPAAPVSEVRARPRRRLPRAAEPARAAA